MKKNFTLILLLCIPFLFVLEGCKSAKKSLKRGDYDDSVLRAAGKLKDNPNHASSGDILKIAYPSALEQHLDEIARSKNSTDDFHWERELDAYVSLNRLFDAIDQCPACSKIVKPRNFNQEEQNAREQAATVRYKEGEKFLSVGDRENARTAFGHFEIAGNILPNFKDSKKKLDLTYELAAFNVVVEQVMVTSKMYQLSNVYFQERINEFLQTNKKMNKFVRFYTPGEASDIKLKPDHVITLQFDDFIVGQTLVERNTETVTSKDSVKTGETTVGRKKVTVYGKVTAKFTKNRKTIHSAGLLDMQIADFQTKRIAHREKFNGEYNWMCEWASFNGDERALTSAQLRMCKSQELVPPAPQQLFVEFSKPIYDQLTNKLKSFYAKY